MDLEYREGEPLEKYFSFFTLGNILMVTGALSTLIPLFAELHSPEVWCVSFAVMALALGISMRSIGRLLRTVDQQHHTILQLEHNVDNASAFAGDELFEGGPTSLHPGMDDIEVSNWAYRVGMADERKVIFGVAEVLVADSFDNALEKGIVQLVDEAAEREITWPPKRLKFFLVYHVNSADTQEYPAGPYIEKVLEN